jgi:predicted TIM-barrel fold metal-dependent hydrolase
LNIRSVYMEVDVAEGQHDREAEYVTKLCRSKSGATIAAVIGGRPSSPQFAEYLDRHAAPGIVQGVRQVLHGGSTPRGYCLKPEFVAGIRVLGEKGLKFDLCMRPDELEDGVKLAELCPDTQFIIDHCGNADPTAFPGQSKSGEAPSHSVDGWKRSMEALAKRPNTVCKISGVVAHAPKGWTAELLEAPVNFCLDTFGPDRVVFGSDWPVCLMGAPLRDWVAALREIIAPRAIEDQSKLWSGNALRLYNLTLA